MNATAAHKGELEKLLQDLSSERLVSGITFVALVDAYIIRLDTNFPDISARDESGSELELLFGHRETISCVSPDPDDSAHLLEYSV